MNVKTEKKKKKKFNKLPKGGPGGRGGEMIELPRIETRREPFRLSKLRRRGLASRGHVHQPSSVKKKKNQEAIEIGAVEYLLI